MPAPNNVTRLLDARGIRYTAYELPSQKLSAVETASFLNVSAELVFKTIVVKRDAPKKPLLVLIPGNAILDLKLLSAALGEKKVYLPAEHEAETLTGLQAGGISPLALIHKGFQVIIDASAMAHDEIHVSGGRRGLNIKLPVTALVELTGAQIHRLARAKHVDGALDPWAITNP